MNIKIPLSIPNLSGNELEYVEKAITTGWVSTAGSYVEAFEKSVAEYVGVKKTVACQSGTAALHLALKVLGIGQDHEVIVPTLSFIASVNPVMYVGASPIFIDCDNTLIMSIEKLERFIKSECIFKNNELINKKTLKRIKAIIIVHIFGNMPDMERLVTLSKKYNFYVIEDACEAIGSKYISGSYSGIHAGTIGHIGVYSFNGNKIITTGGGGMLASKDETFTNKAKYLSTQAKDDPLYYMHNAIGYNYRMTNVQAAIGLAQLENLDKFIIAKKNNYIQYKTRIDKIDGLKLLDFSKDISPNYWFYSLIIDEKVFGVSRDELIKRLSLKGIQTRPIWGLIHEQLPYRDALVYNIKNATNLHKSIINLPCSSNLTQENVEYVCNCLKNIGNGGE